ncbi:malonyl CoA-acyl carrier protein transacylase [Marinobacterium nitratireducens]|uniref:Malonyl CoA-acyl carrier protein transacylase n=1 Tax=Marinobacterium nitratireducens TaxID=518897 RepID=A0A917ZMD8_9GAMM|nr:malonate decarboxylase subunit epsilon [Marinobacterium nitratireducens]GGO86463.1 malonyl CoA-acyl carrier protein transacylase [Marinobacterium nitratireducens]
MLSAFTFPGQGAQRPGMLRQLPTDADAQARIEEAEAVLGHSLETLDSPEALTDTRNVQLALLISGVLWAEYRQRRDGNPDFVLGLSIGAYPAAVVAGSLAFDDALRLVDLRGRLMQQAYPRGYGMLALTGVAQAQVEAAIADQQSEGRAVYLANLNGDQQFVLAGSREAMQDTAERIRAQAPCAGRLLDVAVPSHCALLDAQAQQMEQAFAEVAMKAPACGYVSAARARVLRQPNDIRQDLAQNMARQVHWHDSCRMLAERGLQRVIELPPGSTLTGLFRRVLPQGICQALASALPASTDPDE